MQVPAHLPNLRITAGETQCTTLAPRPAPAPVRPIPTEPARPDVSPVMPARPVVEDLIRTADELETYIAQLITSQTTQARTELVNNILQQFSNRLPVNRDEVLRSVNIILASLPQRAREQELQRQVLFIEESLLKDVATTDDNKPFFFSLNVLRRLETSDQYINPLTRQTILPINEARNLAESWKYWKDRGYSAKRFNELLKEGDPVYYEPLEVERSVVEEFLRENKIPQGRIAAFMRGTRGQNIVDVDKLADLVLAHLPK